MAPKIDSTNATTDIRGPTAYVALVWSSVQEMLKSPAGTVSTERAMTYQLSPLIVIVSDPVGDSSDTSAPEESFASHGGAGTGTEE